MTDLPIVSRITIPAGRNARPLVLLAHAIAELDGDVEAATALVRDLTEDFATYDEPEGGNNSRWPV